MVISPNTKKALSALGVAVASALVVAAQRDLVPLAPVYAQAVLVAVIGGISHWLDAWGHQARVAEQVAAVVEQEK